ncbi:hypothetical protein Dimus_007592, partial [Dionaea muscipula]
VVEYPLRTNMIDSCGSLVKGQDTEGKWYDLRWGKGSGEAKKKRNREENQTGRGRHKK